MHMVCQTQGKALYTCFLFLSHDNCYSCFKDEMGHRDRNNFPKVTELLRTEPVDYPTAPLPGVLLQIPGTSKVPSPLLSQQRPRALAEPVRTAHGRLLLTKEGLLGPDLNCSYSSSFCCKGGKTSEKGMSPLLISLTHKPSDSDN